MMELLKRQNQSRRTDQLRRATSGRRKAEYGAGGGNSAGELACDAWNSD